MPAAIPLRRPAGAPSVAALVREAERIRQQRAPRNLIHPRASVIVPISERVLNGVHYATISIGTPPQELNVVLDTGSSDLWVLSPACLSGACANAQTFDSAASTSFASDGKSVRISYGSGGVAGSVVSDRVALRGLAVETQTFSLITSVDTDLIGRDIAGIMGLGFPSISVSGAPPFWQSLQSAEQLDEPVMSFALARSGDASESAKFTLGTLSPSLYTGEIDYVDVISQSFWTIPVKSISVDGHSIPLIDQIGAIATGTTLIAAPESVVEQVYSAIGGAHGTGELSGLWTYDCSKDPKLELNFGSRSWQISSRDFSMRQLKDSTCLGALFDIPDGTDDEPPPTIIIGEAFLRGVYSVFRFDPPAVGFAVRTTSSGSNETSGSQPDLTDGVDPNHPGPDEHSPSGSKAATIGGAVGGVLGGLLVIGILLALFIIRRRRKANSIQPEMPHAMEVPDLDPNLRGEAQRDGDAPYMRYRPEKRAPPDLGPYTVEPFDPITAGPYTVQSPEPIIADTRTAGESPAQGSGSQAHLRIAAAEETRSMTSSEAPPPRYDFAPSAA